MMAHFRARELLHRLHYVVQNLTLLQFPEDPYHAALTQAGQGRPELGLEDDKGSDGTVLEESLQQVPNENEVQHSGDEVGPAQEENAEQHLHGPGSVDQKEEPIEESRHDEDLDEISPSRSEELELVPNPAHAAPPDPSRFEVFSPSPPASWSDAAPPATFW